MTPAPEQPKRGPGRPPAEGPRPTSTERSRAARARLKAEQGGRTITTQLSAASVAQLEQIKAAQGLRTDADAVRYALQLAAG